MWKWLEQYFTFTQGERKSIIALVVVTLCVLIFPSIYFYFKPVEHINNAKYEREIKAFVDEYNQGVNTALTDTIVTAGNSESKPYSYTKSAPSTFIVDINTADSATLEKLRGIGPVLARRIVKYRELLGGYVTKEQLKEVYGLPAETYEELNSQFSVKSGVVQQINLNTADYKTLKAHPYIKAGFAKAIETYKRNEGNFKTVSDLKKIEAINDSIYRKIAPYITVK